MRTMCFLLITFISVTSIANEVLPDIEIKAIEQGVFLHKSYSYIDEWGLVSSNGLIVVDDDQAFIVDTPWSSTDTEKLVSWVRSKNYQLLGSISTHSHDDRTAGVKWLNDNSIPTYATRLTNEILLQEGKAQAKHAIDKNEFSLANGMLEVFYPGAGHTIDNMIVWLPKYKMLYGGCFVKSLHAKNLGYTGEADIKQWPHSIANATAKYSEAEIVIPGHGKIGGMQLLLHTKTLAENARVEAQKSL